MKIKWYKIKEFINLLSREEIKVNFKIITPEEHIKNRCSDYNYLIP